MDAIPLYLNKISLFTDIQNDKRNIVEVFDDWICWPDIQSSRFEKFIRADDVDMGSIALKDAHCNLLLQSQLESVVRETLSCCALAIRKDITRKYGDVMGIKYRDQRLESEQHSTLLFFHSNDGLLKWEIEQQKWDMKMVCELEISAVLLWQEIE